MIRFGIVTDSHYADIDPLEDNFYRDSLAKMAACIETMNREQVAFLVMLGDLKDQDVPPNEANTLRYLQTIEAELARFNGPRYHVLGNHDVDSISKAQFLTNVENTGIPPTDSYYFFDQGGLRFIVLDACFRSDGVPYNNGDFDWEAAVVPEPQLDWLRKRLAESPYPVIIFIHQPLDEPGKYPLTNAAEVRRVLQDAGNVRAVLQGHRHTEQHNCIEGIHYYTLAAMVKHPGLENNSFAIVEIDADLLIRITGFGRAQGIFLAT